MSAMSPAAKYAAQAAEVLALAESAPSGPMADSATARAQVWATLAVASAIERTGRAVEVSDPVVNAQMSDAVLTAAEYIRRTPRGETLTFDGMNDQQVRSAFDLARQLGPIPGGRP